MPRNGLTADGVIEAAARLIEHSGIEGFSMRVLAQSLNVKTASLYNHVTDMDTLLAGVCAYALQLQSGSELAAIEGKDGDEAIFALAHACRRFAKEHRALYRLIMARAAHTELPEDVSACIVAPFSRVLAEIALDETEKMHWQRVLRGIIHGFVSQEDAGFFAHFPADVDESFQTAIACYITGLRQAEKRILSCRQA